MRLKLTVATLSILGVGCAVLAFSHERLSTWYHLRKVDQCWKDRSSEGVQHIQRLMHLGVHTSFPGVEEEFIESQAIKSVLGCRKISGSLIAALIRCRENDKDIAFYLVLEGPKEGGTYTVKYYWVKSLG